MHDKWIDIYNENMEKVGYATKEDVHNQGLWHKSIHCWLFARKDGIPCVIMQKRASCKLLMPDYFDVSVAGHYEKDEAPNDGFREVKEEFGITVPREAWHYLGIKFDVGISPNAVNKEFCEVFFAEIDSPWTDFILDPKEVDAVVYVPVEVGLQLFSGACEQITIPGFYWNSDENHIIEDTFVVDKSCFIPRIDPYYPKMFAIADLYFRGYPHLYI